jgi:hypothetical protein
MSGTLAIVHHGKPKLLFAACDQLSDEDMRWAPLVCVLPLCVIGLQWVSRQGYCVLVLLVFSVF